MGEVTSTSRPVYAFNGPVEIGLRALAILREAFPEPCSLQKLVVFDYLVVHSDDLPGGPEGLHPKTPHRGEELTVRRGIMQAGLMLYESRGLIARVYAEAGVQFTATERSAAFLDSLAAAYSVNLRERARWLVEQMGSQSDEDLQRLVSENVGKWGAEFELESVLWAELP